MKSAHYPETPASVGRARAFVTEALSGTPEEMLDRAVLLTSELASNAVIHARSPFTVTATMTADEIRVDVTDTGGATPLVRRPDRTETHGRGLLIVSTLADSWGIDTESDRTTVWFVLALEPATVPQVP